MNFKENFKTSFPNFTAILIFLAQRPFHFRSSKVTCSIFLQFIFNRGRGQYVRICSVMS